MACVREKSNVLDTTGNILVRVGEVIAVKWNTVSTYCQKIGYWRAKIPLKTCIYYGFNARLMLLWNGLLSIISAHRYNSDAMRNADGKIRRILWHRPILSCSGATVIFLVFRSVEFSTWRFSPKTSFAVFRRWLMFLLHSSIIWKVFLTFILLWWMDREENRRI